MTRLSRDTIDQWYEYGLHVPTRTLYVGSASEGEDGESGTDFVMAEKTIKGLHLLDTQSAQAITIVMNNLGGDWCHGMAIYDAIKACRSKVTVIGTGAVMSMGSVILQAADRRLLHPNARVMIHYGSMGMASTHAKVFTRWSDDLKKLDRIMEDIYLEKMQEKNPSFTRNKLQKLLNFDTILSATEAIELGLADNLPAYEATED